MKSISRPAAHGVLVLALLSSKAQPALTIVQAPPDTELYLASLAVDGDALKIGTPVNISNSPGYDNQPAFTPDGRAILFTSARRATPEGGGSARSPATDIYRFEIASGAVRQVTATPESEYSPAVTPDGGHLSVVRVELDGTQRLWRYTLNGQAPMLLLPDIKPVGYYAWIDERRLALFVLGEPATLQMADRTSATVEVIARDVGRSLQRVPRGGISYVHVERAADEPSVRRLMVREFDADTRATRALVPAPRDAAEADLAWAPDGALLMAHGGTLYRWRPGASTWTAAADLAALGLHGVTRLAVSPSGDRIAIVAQPRNPDARQASARAPIRGISLALDRRSEEASNGFAREVLVRHPAGEG